MGKYLGIDLGEKRIGLALSDSTKLIAQPYKTLNFRGIKQLINDLKLIVEENDVTKIIVGKPLTLKGTFSPKTGQTVRLIEKLKNALSVPFEMYDERFTTIQAHQTLHQMKKKPSRERDRIDRLAAAHLLQNYLNRERSRGGENGIQK